jgi:hypothetical protein
LLATACKKPLSEVEPLLPPRALTRLSKLVCSDASAELTELLELVSVLDVVPVEVASVLEVDAVLEVDPMLAVLPLLDVAAVPEAAACACKAAIRLCMNC